MSSIPFIAAETDIPKFDSLITPDGLKLGIGEVPTYIKGLAVLAVNKEEAILVAVENVIGGSHFHEYQNKLKNSHFKVKVIKVTQVILDTILSTNNQGNASFVNDVQQMDPKVWEMFSQLICTASDQGASDIHIYAGVEGQSDGWVKHRVNGQLNSQLASLNNDMLISTFSAVYNTISDSTTREESFNKSKIQSCAIPFSFKGKNLKLRYQHTNIYPEGLYIVIRLLDLSKETKTDFNTLGYSKWHQKMLRRVQNKPQGLILMVGTTGSGKSTTLKTLLEQLMDIHEGRINIMTVEDPPEYFIRGARQIPVVTKDKEKAKTAFSDAIRAAMRSDPDALMVGEIRDAETAALIQGATQSGHQAYSTLHAASAIEAVGRLHALGIHHNVMSSSDFFSAIIYQKLVKLLCPTCKKPLTEDDIASFSFGEKDKDLQEYLLKNVDFSKHTLYQKGNKKDCPTCKGEGTKGRTACCEIVIPNVQLLEDISQMNLLKAKQHWKGLRKLDNDEDFDGKSALEHGITKMNRGEISPMDLNSVLGLVSESLIDLENSEKAVNLTVNGYVAPIEAPESETKRATSIFSSDND